MQSQFILKKFPRDLEYLKETEYLQESSIQTYSKYTLTGKLIKNI